MKRNIIVILALAAALGAYIWALYYFGAGCNESCLAPATAPA